jgi:hypothetical protein
MASSEALSPDAAGAAPDAAGAAPDAAGAAALLDALLPDGAAADRVLVHALLPDGAPADRVLVHALLRLAQAELLALDLASATVAAEGDRLVVCCALAGPTPSVSLSSMRALQAYSPARVGEVRAAMRGGRMSLVVDVCDAAARAGTAELERALADVCLV